MLNLTKILLVLATVVFLTSCALQSEVQRAKEEGIRMGQTLSKPQPDAAYQWQLVKMPAVVRGGSVIPEHEEWLLMQGGRTQAMPYMIPSQAVPPPVIEEKVVTISKTRTGKGDKAAAAEYSTLPVDYTDHEVITKHQIVPAKSTGKGNISVLFPEAVFNGKTRDLVLGKDIQYYDLEDIAAKLQAYLNVYVEVTDGILTLSEIKELTFDTGFATEEIAKSLKDAMDHPEAKAYVNKTAGTITVTDNVKGHDNIRKEIAARTDQYQQYHYKVSLTQGEKLVSSAEGNVSAANPIRFTESGGITLAVRGKQISVSALFSKYPDMVTEIISREGGEIEAKRDELELKLKLSRK